MIDCLLIGHNDSDFAEYEKVIRMAGKDSGSYRDLNLNYFNYNNRSYRAMDILNEFINKDKKHKDLHNGDFLNLTIAYLATFLTKYNLNFDYINIFNMQKEELKYKLINEKILSIVIPTTLYVIDNPLIEIIEFIKKYNKEAKIIIGGPLVVNHYIKNNKIISNNVFNTIDADFFVCNSEGEFALKEIIEALKYNRGFEKIDNIVYKEEDKYITNNIYQEDNNLGENLIEWNLFNENKIGEIISLRTSKSCPFSCSFCGFPQRAGKYKFMSVEETERQLDKIKEIGGVNTINFIDDCFNIPHKRFKELLEIMIKNNYNFKWNSYLRCQFIDEETVKLMKESGCEGVFLGIESGSNEILKNMNKTATIEKYEEGIRLLNKYDITTYASFIIGFPGETKDTILETIRFIERTKPTFFRTQLWYYDHLTPIVNEKDIFNIKGSGFQWKHNTMDSVTACNWIDKIFMNIKNSSWLPQNGFDYMSIYYLQRKGMSLNEVKEFVKLFDQLVKNKLIRQHGNNVKENDEFILDRIKEITKSLTLVE